MSSKFANLLSQARNRPIGEGTTEESTVEPKVEQGSESSNIGGKQPLQLTAPTPLAARTQNNTKQAKSSTPTRRTAALDTPIQTQPIAAEISSRGRPRTGKRSDPNYTQITAYITKQTHRDVKVALLQEGQGREISEVVEECLAAWLKQQK
ncbi:hypothetical protein IAD21_06438 (plasmid) [Abditibacteriota bacterium]|nr:hypothetical protein IAD21_06438 [Abditibacteriota bacterium]